MKRQSLAAYLVFALVAQVALYIRWMRVPSDSLFYFDPRIGLFVFEESLHKQSLHHPGALSWVSVGWLALTIIALVGMPSGRRLYRLSEIILALPSVLFFGIVVAANMSAAHGFSIAELAVPLLIFGAFTLVPFILSLRVPRGDEVRVAGRVV